jgi:hypothetical protein
MSPPLKVRPPGTRAKGPGSNIGRKSRRRVIRKGGRRNPRRALRSAVRQSTPQLVRLLAEVDKRFETTTKTDWHYECANALISDSITVWPTT